MIRLGIVPLAISMFCFSFGPVTIGTNVILDMIGGEDRMAVIMPIATVREIGTFLTAIVLAGVIGTAICADLGARRVREELDAMSVMGVDPVRKLVAPRLLAFVAVIPLMTLIAYEVGMLAAFVGTVFLFGVDGTVFLASYGDALVTAELIASMLKTVLYGLLIGAVFCYAGLNASGGAEGVGRAVNQAVVAVVVAILVLNFAYNSALLSLFPELQAVR